MRYNTIKHNDIANAPGVCVSIYLQGCPHHCPGCFNPETWSFSGGTPWSEEAMDEVLTALTANGIHRDLCILGGEPLCPENLPLTEMIAATVKSYYPEVKIYIWTGYVYENLRDSAYERLWNSIDVLIDGPFIEAERDLTLHMRGSRNQRIIDIKKNI